MTTEEKSPVAEWYKNRSIFITGGTGFMGKVLVEKLLYSCSGVKMIYLLLRSKKGRTPQQRIEDMWKLPMFERLRKSQPNAIKKLKALPGDLNTDGLSLSPTDLDILIDNVSVVFHIGATLRLEAKLKDAIEQNTAGTVRVLNIARKIRQLKAFVYYSTAFCSADLEEFEEKVYDCRDNPRDVIDVCRWINPDALEAATPALIAPHPNTYTYSKRLAETLVANEAPNMPVCIIRPSVVTPSWSEPLPGWVDSLNGPIGLLVGAGKGVIRSMHCRGENSVQIIPVDTAICATLVATQRLGSATQRPREVPVYNLTQDGVIQATYKEVLDKGRKIVYDNPFEMQIWYPDGDIRSSWYIHFIYSIFLHWLPAYFIDALLFIFRQKRFMVRLQHRIHDGLELLQFFTTREWKFHSKKFLGLYNTMTEKDKELFPMDFTLMPMEEYLRICVLGARQYCMKEDLSSLPRCRIQQKILYVVHKLFVFTLYFGILWLIISCSSTAKALFDVAGGYVKMLPIVRTVAN